MQRQEPRYKRLTEQDPNLRRWFLNNSKGSPRRAEIYARQLNYFCESINLTPSEYAKLPKRKMEEMAFDYIQELETKTSPKTGQRYAPTYIVSCLRPILSWAKWNRKTFEMKIKVADTGKRPTLLNERVPTQDELRRVLYADTTHLRTRVSIAIMAFAGCRIEVQGNYPGNEGLRIRDFPELAIDGKEVTFQEIPTLMIVRSELSKNRHWYPTFLPQEGCEILKQWLERRIAEGEILTSDSGIIVTIQGELYRLRNVRSTDPSPFLRTVSIGDTIRSAMRRAGLPWRPYVFRSYFDTMLMLGESKGYVSHSYQQLWMGHGNIEQVYTTRKGQLPPELIESMREAYARTSELLSTNKPNVSMSEVQLATRKEILEFSGFTEQEIAALGDLSKYSMQDLKELDRKKESEKLGLNGHSTQKIIPWNELRQHIMDGWELVSKLEDTNEAIVRLPK